MAGSGIRPRHYYLRPVEGHWKACMNDDRCYHVPTSPGQSVCTCLDRRMWLELALELAARRIVELEAAVQRRKPEVLTIGVPSDTVVSSVQPRPEGYAMANTNDILSKAFGAAEAAKRRATTAEEFAAASEAFSRLAIAMAAAGKSGVS